MEFWKDILDFVDVLTDFKLSYVMYTIAWYDFQNESGEATGDYNICFVWICLSLITPVILQYSTLNSWMFSNDLLSTQKLKQYGCIRRTFMKMQLTFLGFFNVLFLEVMYKL